MPDGYDQDLTTHNESRHVSADTTSRIPLLDHSIKALYAGQHKGQPPPITSQCNSLKVSLAQLEEPAISNAQTIFSCPFYHLSCFLSFDNYEAWQSHSISHFQLVGPPQSVICCFCSIVFRTSSGSSALVTWKTYMEHLAFHLREGYKMVQAKPGSVLYKYMFEKHLISSSMFEATHMVPNHTGVGTVSPAPRVPSSGAFNVDSLRSTTWHPIRRKRRLAPEEKEHANLVRKQGACKECRQKKQKVLDYSVRACCIKSIY